MARDGTQSRAAHSFGAIGSVVTLLLASVALTALTRRKHGPLPPLPVLTAAVLQTPGRGPARFLSGSLAGVTTGIVLGVTAALLITMAHPHLRSAVIVGAGFGSPRVTDGEYVARVMAQAMNPTLVYADDADVTAFLVRPAPEPEEAPALSPVERQIEDNAALIFAVLGGLTMASWGVLMWGLSGGYLSRAEAGLE